MKNLFLKIFAFVFACLFFAFVLFLAISNCQDKNGDFLSVWDIITGEK